MALIIKVDMPISCGYTCDLWSEGICVQLQRSVDTHTRHPDCPIIGEIPDRHGRIVDISKVEDFLTKWENGELDYEPPLDEVLSMIRYSTKTIVEATE